MNKSLKILFIWVVYIFFVFVMYAYFSADVFYFSSQRKSLKNISRREVYSRRAVELNPFETRYYVSRAHYILENDSNFDEDGVEILILIEIAKNKNPKDLVLYSDLVPVYAGMAKKFNYREEAGDFYSFLKNEYPEDLGLMAKIAYYEKDLEMRESYEKTIEIIKKLRPDVLDWHYLLR